MDIVRAYLQCVSLRFNFQENGRLFLTSITTQLSLTRQTCIRGHLLLRLPPIYDVVDTFHVGVAIRHASTIRTIQEHRDRFRVTIPIANLAPH